LPEGALTGLQYVTSLAPFGTQANKGSVARCPDGKTPIGGGAVPSSRGIAITESFPLNGPGVGGYGWEAEATAMPGVTHDASWGLYVFAICVNRP
jgi:hypothetical protein